MPHCVPLGCIREMLGHSNLNPHGSKALQIKIVKAQSADLSLPTALEGYIYHKILCKIQSNTVRACRIPSYKRGDVF